MTTVKRLADDLKAVSQMFDTPVHTLSYVSCSSIRLGVDCVCGCSVSNLSFLALANSELRNSASIIHCLAE